MTVPDKVKVILRSRAVCSGAGAGRAQGRAGEVKGLELARLAAETAFRRRAIRAREQTSRYGLFRVVPVR